LSGEDDARRRSGVAATDRITAADTAIPDGTTTPGDTLVSAAHTAGGEAVDVGRVLAGKYVLERLLGAGGMGKVWKGVHQGLGIAVAIKTMHPEIAANADYARRFRREAHAASLLDHPNVVRVLDFGEDAGTGTLYLVMEYLEGRSLTKWLQGHEGPPPLAEVVEILVPLCDALEVAHSYGIVHRDLKPDNVFLTTALGHRVVKVVDFGLAHVDDARDQGPTLTSKDVIAGTPEYMSPEQCRSLAVGASADVYAVGCILTELLQRAPPFTGGSSIEVLAKQMFTQPPPLRRPAGAEPVPPLLERLRLDLLAKSADKRPHDAAEIRARLLEAMSPEAEAARLPTRKGDEPLGDRAARATAWALPQPAHAAHGDDAVPEGERARVGLLRLQREPGGVGEEQETGLAAHGIDAVALADAAEAATKGVRAVVVDAGGAMDAALAALATLARTSAHVATIVCARDLTTERMNALVGAGAADVLRYPVAPDKLARKLERVLRRGR
jgi:serine/threonine-protein kinase